MSAPIRRLSTLQRPVFLLNSRRTRFTAAPSGYEPYRGTPSPEVTGLICRVPERAFSRAPLDILLVYLCRFVVRFPTFLLRGFSRQRGISSFRPYGLLLCASVLMSLRICLEKPPYAHRTGHNRPAYPSASPHRDNEKLGVPEY